MNQTSLSLLLCRNTVNVQAYLAVVDVDSYEAFRQDVNRLLHPNELELYANLKSEKRKITYLTGRIAAKLSISEYMNELQLNTIEIAAGCFDQPVVRYAHLDAPEVSLTHCDRIASAIAFPRGHIMGIDVDNVDFGKSQAVKSQLSQTEIETAELAFSETHVGYQVVWTAKAALSKALKCGLTVPFEILDTEHMEQHESGRYEANYRNFAQYKCVSWIVGRYVFSVAMPRKTTTELDLKSALQWLMEAT